MSETTHWLLGEFASRYGEHPLNSFVTLFPRPFLLEVFHHGRESWEELRLVPLTGSFQVGRDEDCLLRLADDGVAPAQARIREPRGRSEPWRVRNLSSPNTTLHNGTPVREAPLKDMDLLTFGAGVRYVFVLAPTLHRVMISASKPLDEELIAFLEGRAPAAPDAPVMCPGVLARVRCFLHCGPGHSIPLEPGSKLLIGRNGASDIRLNDKSVSRAHAEFQCRADGAIIRDLCSSNGTRLDGVEISGEPTRILPDQQVQVGPFQITLDSECPHKKRLPEAGPAGEATP